MKELLRSIYKPVIVLPNRKDFKLDNLLLLDDGAYNANKTLFTFFYMFDEQKVDVLRVNVEEDESNQKLSERFGDNYNLILREGDTVKKLWSCINGRFEIYSNGGKNYRKTWNKIAGKSWCTNIPSIKLCHV